MPLRGWSLGPESVALCEEGIPRDEPDNPKIRFLRKSIDDIRMAATAKPSASMTTATSLTDGDLVWIKWGSRPWPARKCSESDATAGVIKAKRCTSERLFLTFGDHLHVWVSSVWLYEYEARNNPPAAKPSKLLAVAIDEIKAAALARDNLWECWACTFRNPAEKKRCDVCGTKAAAKRKDIAHDDGQEPKRHQAETAQDTEMHAYAEGSRIAVHFDGEPYNGVITGFNGSVYAVHFDDGNVHEDISETEIKLLSEHTPATVDDTDWMQPHAYAKGSRVAVNFAPGGEGRRTRRCGECTACLAPECGTCEICLDKPKFGGPGNKRRSCIRRKCMAPATTVTAAGAAEPYSGVVVGFNGCTARREPVYEVHFDDDDKHDDITEAEITVLSEHSADTTQSAPMRCLRGAELGCGTARLAKAAMRRGFEMIALDRKIEALDYDEELLPRDSDAVWIKELRDVRPEAMPTLDYLHFSPSCNSTSLMAASHHERVESNDFQGTSEACEWWNSDCMHFYTMVQHQRNRPDNEHCAFTFEQPAGRARHTLVAKLLEQPAVSGGLGAVRITIDMCRHGLDCQKPTDLWVGGLPSLVDALSQPPGDDGTRVSKWRCSRSSPCKHFPAHPQVRGNSKHAWACAFPEELCAFLMAYVERDLCKHRGTARAEDPGR